MAALRKSLAESKVIQVARTGPAQYVFPWALVYDHALPNPDATQFCPVLDEWAEDGRRHDEAIGARCPAQRGAIACAGRSNLPLWVVRTVTSD